MEQDEKSKTAANETVWYGIQTFHCKEELLAAYLRTQGLEVFIPMRYTEQTDEKGKSRRILVPAVHNLLFLRKTQSEQRLQESLRESPIPYSIYKNRETARFVLIPDNEMTELRAICDPNYTGTLFVEHTVADARAGAIVRVIRGQFKGLIGKLTRYQRRSYVVITALNIGVMVHIPKWYCEEIKKDNAT